MNQSLNVREKVVYQKKKKKMWEKKLPQCNILTCVNNSENDGQRRTTLVNFDSTLWLGTILPYQISW